MKNEEISRLNFEDIIWQIFILLSVLNILSNQDQKQYTKTNNPEYEDRANNRTIFVQSVLLIIYLYFFIRNVNMYQNKAYPTKADTIKVLGSLLFIIATICLLYFQIHSKDNFINTTEL